MFGRCVGCLLRLMGFQVGICYKVSGDGEQKRWVATCGRVLLFVRGVGSGDVSCL